VIPVVVALQLKATKSFDKNHYELENVEIRQILGEAAAVESKKYKILTP
jgi:hypothetical protein